MAESSSSGHLVREELEGGIHVNVHVNEQTFNRLQTDGVFRSQWFQTYRIQVGGQDCSTANTQDCSTASTQDCSTASSHDHSTASTEMTYSSKESSLTQLWDRPKTLTLIELYKDNMERMSSPQVRQKTVWEQITAEINSTWNANFQCQQVEGRWKTVLSSYRKCKDAKKESGGARKSYEYEAELDEILIDSHTTQPAFTFSSGKENDNRGIDSNENENKRKSEDVVEDEKLENKKTRTSGSDKVLTFLEGFIEKSEKMEKEKMEEAKKMHNEKMGIFRELITAFKK